MSSRCLTASTEQQLRREGLDSEHCTRNQGCFGQTGFFSIQIALFSIQASLFLQAYSISPSQSQEAAAWGGAAAAVPSMAGGEQGPSEERELGPRLPLLQVSAAAAGSICHELIPLSLRCSGERSSSTFPAD